MRKLRLFSLPALTPRAITPWPYTHRHPSKALSLLAAVACLSITGCVAPKSATTIPGSEIAHRSGFSSGQRTQPLEFSWPAGIRPFQPLSEEQAISVALWNNPEFQAALSGLGLARAEVIKAGQLPNPGLGLLFPNNMKALEQVTRLPMDALLLRPLRLKAATLDAQSIAGSLTQGGLEVIRKVRVACAGIELARKRRQFASESAGSLEEMARVAEGRLSAGDSGELEPSQARAEAQVSRQEAQRLAYEEKLAHETLRSLLGLNAGGGSLTLLPLPPVRTGAPPSRDALLKSALSGRPDVRAAELTVMAAGIRARLARAEILNLTVIGKFTNDSGTQAGIDGQLPLLHQNQSGRAQAAAGLAKALLQLNAARERAAGEIRTASVRLEEARSVSRGWGTVLPSLRTALDKARRAAELGETNQLTALDAARRLADAQAKAAESEARLREAWADLEHAAGGKLP